MESFDERMMRLALSEAEKARAEGRLNNEELDSFKSMLYPFLDKGGKAELDKIVERLKKS